MKKYLRVTTGAMISLAITFALELIFALIVRSLCLSAAVIRPVNQVIKAVSVIIGALIVVNEKGIIYGLLHGVIYGALANVIMSIIGGNFYAGRFFLDLLFCSVIGILSGLIAVNVKKR